MKKSYIGFYSPSLWCSLLSNRPSSLPLKTLWKSSSFYAPSVKDSMSLEIYICASFCKACLHRWTSKSHFLIDNSTSTLGSTILSTRCAFQWLVVHSESLKYNVQLWTLGDYFSLTNIWWSKNLEFINVQQWNDDNGKQCGGESKGLQWLAISIGQGSMGVAMVVR